MKHFLALCLLICASTTAQAAPLHPGTVVFPVGKTFGDPVHGGLQLIVNDNLLPFSVDPTPVITPLQNIGGSVQNRVTQRMGDDDKLNFMPRIRQTYNIDGGIFAIVGMVLTGYGSFDIDADFRTDGAGDKGPTSLSRSVDGDTITVRFNTAPTTGGLVINSLNPAPQETSNFLSLVTQTKHYDFSGTAKVLGYLIDEDRYNAGEGIFAPAGFSAATDILNTTVTGLAVPKMAPVPLPASALLLGAGIAGLGLMRRKRKAT